MPRPILTPEQRKANQKAAKQRYKARHPERAKASATATHKRWRAKNSEKVSAKAHERYVVKRDAMTPEALETFRQRHNESRQRYYASHTEEVCAKAREHWAKPEIRARELARQKARWEENPEYWHAYGREARVRNIDTHKAAQKRWVGNNRAKTVLAVAKRRALKYAAPRNDLTQQQWLDIQATQDYCCAYCGTRCEGRLTQEHITPLTKGGSHTLHNVIGACSRCNSRKGNRDVLRPVQPLLL
jgi:5-methylcytosine-specific restriction endonuclease McrA